MNKSSLQKELGSRGGFVRSTLYVVVARFSPFSPYTAVAISSVDSKKGISLESCVSNRRFYQLNPGKYRLYRVWIPVKP